MELPPAFAHYTRSLLGDDDYARLALALREEPPVSLRLNALKPLPATPAFLSVPWAATGRYLDRRLTFTFDPLFHAGCYYVQEASSMFVEQAVRQYVSGPVVALDLCAAPGGKSTHLRGLLPQGSLLVSNELVRDRSYVLAENLTKWGHPDVVVTGNDPADFQTLRTRFDLILADVPCSGEGMFRKDDTAVKEWSPRNVEACQERQRRIVAHIWPSLKPGGLFIYSTCTYNKLEDEENVRWIVDRWGAEPLPIATDEAWGIAGNLLDNDEAMPVYRFFPHRTRGEGFFLALLRKPDDGGEEEENEKEENRPSRQKAGKRKTERSDGYPTLVSKETIRIAESWLMAEAADTYALTVEGNKLNALAQRHAATVDLLRRHLRVIQAGVGVGEARGKDLIPAHALAMSARLLDKEAFANVEVSYGQAIDYLRKEAIALPADTPRGYLLLCYQGVPLGFVKNVGNRANNLYPAEWRIRSGYLPAEVSTISSPS
ncbi:MAG: rRNA cytosine-C5-methyltransferase [Mediterranea sp.]|jgi:16S rRNA C967 or C1407 C5-methylase (RsmB/RsmF family)/NOL1/NOP2/fmu family ribosome biogenesis protein|nr:rRNA cytosine-C5-methyltransferase [Mediterranea sp.]